MREGEGELGEGVVEVGGGDGGEGAVLVCCGQREKSEGKEVGTHAVEAPGVFELVLAPDGGQLGGGV